VKKAITILLVLAVPLFSQIPGFTDDFEDGTLDITWNGEVDTLWWNDWYPNVFNLSEVDGYLKIDYTRSGVADWPAFYFIPPENIDVSINPKIILSIKSDKTIQFAIKPEYNNGNENFQNVGNIPGDNAWHTYTITISNYSGGYCERVVFHFDGGSLISKQGTVYFDDFKIAGFSINISDLTANFDAENQVVNLSWECSKEEATDYYNIYRDTVSGFSCDSETFIGDTTLKVYNDSGFENYTWYYYKVTAVDTLGEEHAASPEVSCKTYTTGTIPEVEVTEVNSDTIGKYEKFEIKLRLDYASYANPYNPEEIDVHAYFLSPEGDTTWVNTFYDNYNNKDEWKVRFSPYLVGEWEYQVFAKDVDGTGENVKHTFTAIESDYHGCLNVSPDNPHYLVYHDGTSFYGVGAYYPWGVNTEGLNLLEESGVNIFGYWNGNYDNGGNGGGIHQIESARTGIGYYDQDKCARVDEILNWAEARDLKMMFALWPHDVLDKNVWGYNGWEENAFKEICAASEFYSDSLSWEYQKKLYRYIIARWGYSRSMGIWEIVNEINGTDGWAYGNHSAVLEWIQKVHSYFKENDYFNRPTTISKSGGSQNYWMAGYQICDMPNVHLYETGWSALFPDDHIRSSYCTYRNITRQFWNQFDKPGIFGEAGYTNNYGNFSPGSNEYERMYHNALWVSWANGLAATPIWWEFGTKSIFTPSLMEQMHAFSQIVQSIDYAHISLSQASISVTECDAYAMKADSMAFGWIRDIDGNYVSGQLFTLEGLPDTSYSIMWLNPWTGDTVKTNFRVSQDGQLIDQIPQLSQDLLDLAFIVQPAENGDIPERLELMAYPTELYSDTSYTSQITCFVLDAQGRICTQADNSITYTLEGTGTIEGTNPVAANNGIADIIFKANRNAGIAQIIASSSGLIADTVNIVIHKFLYIYDFEQIPQTFNLYPNYPNPFNSTTTIQYDVVKPSHVTIAIFNANGQLIEILIDSQRDAGQYMISWDGSDMASGLYFFRMQADYYEITKKCLLLK